MGAVDSVEEEGCFTESPALTSSDSHNPQMESNAGPATINASEENCSAEHSTCRFEDISTAAEQ